MARLGPRAGNAARRRAKNLGVLIVMVLVSLAGAMLFSAGSDHHRFDPAAIGPVLPAAAGAELTLDGPGQHDHHRGNEWTPTIGSRVRVIAPATTAFSPGHQPGSTPLTAGTPAVHDVPAPIGELNQPGVLRV
jgi:hypothetical protein